VDVVLLPSRSMPVKPISWYLRSRTNGLFRTLSVEFVGFEPLFAVPRTDAFIVEPLDLNDGLHRHSNWHDACFCKGRGNATTYLRGRAYR
jgi:hypothetical protein